MGACNLSSEQTTIWSKHIRLSVLNGSTHKAGVNGSASCSCATRRAQRPLAGPHTNADRAAPTVLLPRRRNSDCFHHLGRRSAGSAGSAAKLAKPARRRDDRLDSRFVLDDG